MSVEIMAIINTSPDSFNGDGINPADQATLAARLRTALAEGADILDIGGQSTRPGAEIISVQDEIERVVPAIRLARTLTDKPISVDTFKPEVARAAIDAGATMVNDISGCADQSMIELVAASGLDVVIMHMRGTSQTMSGLTTYENGVVSEVQEFLQQQAAKLIAAGVAAEHIIIDPGIGFAKNAPQSFELTRHLEGLVKLGYRVLYGASQKSFIGKALAENGVIAPLERRAVGTVAMQFYAMLQGASIIRVHDVDAAVQTRTMAEALLAERKVMP